MERVLLKREWRTPLGRFRKSINGVPCDVPSRVLRRYSLPRDAVVVPENYIPPLEREPGDEDSMEITAAEQEAEINRRVAAQVALEEARRRGNKMAGVAEKAEEALDAEISALLEGTVEQVKDRVDGIKLAEDVDELLEQEKKGKNRKNVLVMLEARKEDLSTPDAA